MFPRDGDNFERGQGFQGYPGPKIFKEIQKKAAFGVAILYFPVLYVLDAGASDRTRERAAYERRTKQRGRPTL